MQTYERPSARPGHHRPHNLRVLKRFSTILLACGCLVAGLNAPAASASTVTPGVIPPGAHPYGKSYGQWSAAWWQWAFQTPVNANGPAGEQNPLTVGSKPIDCSYGQSGKVWFLSGTLNTPANAVRSCTKPIPGEITLMFPVINAEQDNVTCPPPTPPKPTTYDEDQLRALAKGFEDTAFGMSATIDGSPVTDISSAQSDTAYRVTSPLFKYAVPKDNIYSVVCGARYPAGRVPAPGGVADGVFVMLARLAPGVHVLQWGGQTANGFSQVIKYTLSVR
jgi:hypothetical protein